MPRREAVVIVPRTAPHHAAGGRRNRYGRAGSPSRYTDDTALTLALARSLLHCGHLDLDHVAVAFADAYRREPHRGYGAGAARCWMPSPTGPTGAVWPCPGLGGGGRSVTGLPCGWRRLPSMPPLRRRRHWLGKG
ncbi:MAG: ADP-ribosylglycohydrolase family protein [Actinomycetota bacterium]|nr:ADP-ribosylglycohydrolase family protein [Actinomycetota bacterium]